MKKQLPAIFLLLLCLNITNPAVIYGQSGNASDQNIPVTTEPPTPSAGDIYRQADENNPEGQGDQTSEQAMNIIETVGGYINSFFNWLGL